MLLIFCGELAIENVFSPVESYTSTAKSTSLSVDINNLFEQGLGNTLKKEWLSVNLNNCLLLLSITMGFGESSSLLLKIQALKAPRLATTKS